MFVHSWIPLVEWFVGARFRRDELEEQGSFQGVCAGLQRLYGIAYEARQCAVERTYQYDDSPFHIAIGHTDTIAHKAGYLMADEEMVALSGALDVVRLTHISNQMTISEYHFVAVPRKSANLLTSAYWAARHMALSSDDMDTRRVAAELLDLVEEKIAVSRARYAAMWDHIDSEARTNGRVALCRKVARESYVMQAA